MTSSDQRVAGSFRDPNGFVFWREGTLYRQINHAYLPHYDRLMQSGLYDRLVRAGQLIPHEVVQAAPAQPEQAALIIRPEPVPFLSYPYEWSFGQLREAALTTLSILKKALEAGMVLKDASAYNIQFHHGRPVLIDTLSFEVYQAGSPWVAYRQFCQHFLAPLALMAHRDVRLGQLLRVYIDGLPLDLVSRLLPLHTRLNPGLAAHLHLHARAQKRFAGEPVTRRAMSQLALQGLIESLQSTVRALHWNPQGTAWGEYYDSTNYTRQAFEAKEAIVAEWASRLQPQLTWDLGANTGVFSRAVARTGGLVVSWDIDPAAVEKNYRQVRQAKEKNILPLLIDLTNPSPALGWSHAERASLMERAPADLALALALIHHLAIANNVPLEDIARFLSQVCRWLIIEFVPKDDSQVQRLLSSRDDIFPKYTPEGFERAFAGYFTLHEKRPLDGSARVLYLMEKK